MRHETQPHQEFYPALTAVGTYLIDEVVAKPGLSPTDAFTIAKTVAEHLGTDAAYDKANELLAEGQVDSSYEIAEFARMYIKTGDETSLLNAHGVAMRIKPDHQDLVRQELMLEIAQATQRPETRAAITSDLRPDLLSRRQESHVSTSDAAKPQLSYVSYDPASVLLLKLGILDRDAETITDAAVNLHPRGVLAKYEMLETIATTLGTDTVDSDLRSTLVDAAIKVQSIGSTLPHAVVRGYEKVLTDDEMRRMISAVIARPNVRFISSFQHVDAENPGIVLPHSTELKDFNKIVSRLGEWDSLGERMRFSIQALKASREATRGGRMINAGQARAGFESALWSANRLEKNLDQLGDLDDPKMIDALLQNMGWTYRELHSDKSTRELASMTNVYWSMMEQSIEKSYLPHASPESLGDTSVYRIRDKLPLSCISRLDLDLALFKAGDKSAAQDAIKVLMSQPKGYPESLSTDGNTRAVTRPYKEFFSAMLPKISSAQA